MKTQLPASFPDIHLSGLFYLIGLELFLPGAACGRSLFAVSGVAQRDDAVYNQNRKMKEVHPVSGMIHQRMEDMAVSHKVHGDFEYYKRTFVPRGTGETLVCVYEIPPLKSAYPYHYHLRDEETFHILSGEGMLKTPEGERLVKAGDLLYFPAGPDGAHRLTNISGTEMLVYLDFDVIHDLDVCIYPDSGKIAVWGKNVNRVYPLEANVDYYQGE